MAHISMGDSAIAQQLPPTLRELDSLLQPLQLAALVEPAMLRPGQRREQLVRCLLSRLLGGVNVDALDCGSTDAAAALAPDERFAHKCQALLQLLGITTTPEQLRHLWVSALLQGCAASAELNAAPLLAMAQLLQAMDRQRSRAQRAAGGAAAAAQQQAGEASEAPHAGAAMSGISQLLGAAAANLSRLTAEDAHLFPSDMSDVLRVYSDQGALVQLPQLCQQATERAQQLQQQLQDALQAGGSSCGDAGSAAWQAQVAELSAALQQLLTHMQAFDGMYQQELSVWASVTHGGAPPRQPGASGDGAEAWPAADAMGSMAATLLGAYQQLSTLLGALDTIRARHAALKDVPAKKLAEQRSQHSTDVNKLRMYTAAVQQPCTR